MGKGQRVLTSIKESVFAFVSIILIGLSNNVVAEICYDPLSKPSPSASTSTTTSSSSTTTDTTLIEQGKPSNPQANSRGGDVSAQHFCSQEPPPPSPTPPTAPFGLTYSISNNSTGTVSISWASNASATHYVEESKNGGTWVAAGAITLTSFVLSDRRMELLNIVLNRAMVVDVVPITQALRS